MTSNSIRAFCGEDEPKEKKNGNSTTVYGTKSCQFSRYYHTERKKFNPYPLLDLLPDDAGHLISVQFHHWVIYLDSLAIGVLVGRRKRKKR